MISLLWRWSPVITFPLALALVLLAVNTANRFIEVGITQIGDRGLSPLSLQEVGRIEFDRLTRRFWGRVPVTDFRHLSLFVPEKELDRLDSDLPVSGRRYVPATVFLDGKRYTVQVRYRGDYHLHWGFPKKSYRLKAKKKKLVDGMRHINLIVPKTQVLLNNYLSYQLADLLGLMTPVHEMVQVSLNGEYQGLYLLAEQINEGLLRRQNRLPGDIYSGDQLFGFARWTGVGDSLFDHPGLWDKSAVNNKYPEDHRKPLERLLTLLNRPPGRETDEAIRQLVNLESFARFSVMETLLSTGHHDERHNWKLYFDPVLGQFEPLVWDSYGWNPTYLSGGASSLWTEEDTPPDRILVSRLMQVMHRLKEFEGLRQRVLKEFYALEGDVKILSQFDQLRHRLRPLVPFERTGVDSNHRRIRILDHDVAADRMEKDMTRIFSYHRSRLVQDPPKLAEPQIEPLRWSGEVVVAMDQVIDSPILIASNTTVRLAADVQLRFLGRVDATGTVEEPIVFERLDPAAPWGSVVLRGEGANGSVLKNVHMSGGSASDDGSTLTSGMLSIHDVSQVTLFGCRLAGNVIGDDMLHAVYSQLRIEACEFSGAAADAVDLDFSIADIVRSDFRDSGNDGLDLMGSQATVLESSFSGNGDKGISTGEASSLVASGNTLTGNSIGVEVKDGSTASLTNNAFTDNGTAINLYRKNWHYGAGGRVTHCGNTWHNNGVGITRDGRSGVEPCAQ